MEDKIIESKNVEEVKKEEKKSIRSILYGNIDVSVETMDKFLVVLFIAMILSLIFGIVL
ncbi:hypothetical protein [Clostridium isatidis]|uniref:hypothetical protein n=1 Tax=Clostridium isatidis TaxID=182773 RepID=UPI0013DF8983|nr:hypothetical protein [Clostridium isatidis]NLZ35068.1 hypothetical protein [Clostridiales bacterium]